MTPGTTLPRDVETGLARLLREHTGRTPTRFTAHPLSGGCINHATRVVSDLGDEVFVKWNAECPADFFSREAEGLAALGAVGALRVPAVLGLSEADDRGPAWLALEFIPTGPPSLDYEARLGDGLARLHGASPLEGAFGWMTDNYIGALPQPNGIHDDWVEFWRDRRIRPQLRQAAPMLSGEDVRQFDRLIQLLEAVIGPGRTEPASLLHGDLWSGNVYSGPDGRPVLIDPAVYAGHREVDLAMTQLFGGFGAGFYEAYEDAAGPCISCIHCWCT